MKSPTITTIQMNTSTSFFTLKRFIIFCLILFVILYYLSRSHRKQLRTFSVENVGIKPREKPWYFINGTAKAVQSKFSATLGRRDANVLPNEDPGDRFENQLMFIPPGYDEKKVKKNKTILLYYHTEEGWWDLERQWNTWFTNNRCPVNRCRFTKDVQNETATADMIVFSGLHETVNLTKASHQVYAFYALENPIHYNGKYPKSFIYNWTMTYRHDSTIPIYYTKWAYYDPRIKKMKQTVNYAQNKTKKVAILVSNCEAHNDRQIYVTKLSKYIEVDVYGKCGTKNCSEDLGKCLDMVTRDYKFYLSFENSHCADYITEKVYRNAMGQYHYSHGALPVVLGARREDYERQLPENSYIFVEDFATPKDLADYLHKVDKDDDLYNSYFQWKGTGELLEKWDRLWCRACALLHDEHTMKTPHWYDDINKWWFDPETLRRGFWRNTQG